MKNIKFLFIVIIFLSFYRLKAQPIPPPCNIINNSSSSATHNYSNDCYDYITSYDNAPILNIYINAHIVVSDKNESPQLLVQNVQNFIAECNKVLDNAQPGFPIGNPPTYSTPWIPRAKIKLKLYSDLSVRPDDQYGGIWVYPYQTGLDVNDKDLDHYKGWLQHNTNYGSKVLNIIFVNRSYYDNTSFDFGRGLTNVPSSNSSNEIWVSDLNRIFFMSNQPGNTDNFLKQLSRTTNHEVGHVLGLRHSEDCNNECSKSLNPKGDIDPVRECGPVNCPTIHNCAGFNPTDADSRCPDVAKSYACTWGNGTLLTSQGWWDWTITPCEWGYMFNYALNNQIDFYKLCHTASNYTLPTSPEREYRASQSIASTSTITANRDVDYFSPTTTLNPGFAVALGAHFLAYPALFSCCINGTGSGERGQESAGVSDNAALKVAPNPFDGVVDVDFIVGLDAENVNLYMTDINGRVVKSVFSGEKPKGSYKMQVKTNDLPNGFYLLNLQGQNRFSSKKVVKIAGF